MNSNYIQTYIKKSVISTFFDKCSVLEDKCSKNIKIRRFFMSYIHFTDEQKERARQTDIVSLLESEGETVKRSGSEYEWKDGSQKVTIRSNLWFHQYEQVGGDAIDFVRKFYNKDYPEAMEYLLGNNIGTLKTFPPVVKEIKPFELPPKNENISRVKAYLLHTRGIDEDVFQAFVDKGLIYESADYHNAIFVGYDKDGIPRHAHKRGSGSQSTYKGNAPNSQPEYSFHRFGTSKYLFLFEAPIDMLSFISMHKENWINHSYAASCSVSDRVLFQCLKDNPNIKKVYLCFDNDEPGQIASDKISKKLSEKGIQSEILVPKLKDWNEDLQSAVNNAPHKSADFFISRKNEEEGENQCQTLVL